MHNEYPKGAVAYLTLAQPKGRRNDDVTYCEQRHRGRLAAKRQRLRVRLTLCDHLNDCPADLFRRDGIRQLLRAVGKMIRTKKTPFMAAAVVVEDRKCFAANSEQLAVLLVHLRHSLVPVYEYSSQLDISRETVLTDDILTQIPHSQLQSLQRKLAAAKSHGVQRKTKGKSGRPPFGANPREREILEEIWRLRRKPPGKPRRTYGKIAELLNQKGFTTRSGGPWQASTIRGIIERTRPYLAPRHHATSYWWF